MHFSRENVIVRIQGGFGNQLFQYATGKSLALRLGVGLVLDINWYIDKNNSHSQFILNRLEINDKTSTSYRRLPRRLRTVLYKFSESLSPFGLSPRVLKDSDFKFNYDLLNIDQPVLLDGYWQNEHYFKQYRKEIIKLFKIKREVNSENKQLLNKIENSNSICIHIRRGDYITDPKAYKINGICSKDYYYRSLDKLASKIDLPKCYVFSDEPDWAKNNLKFDYDSYFVNINNFDEPELDFLLMKSCKYFIIANSTFSWWAAWLSDYEDKKVIAPRNWFKNKTLNKNMKLPSTWIRM